MITVYILLLSNGKYYTGMTNCIERRFLEHSSGRSKSTKRNLPCELIHTELHRDRKAARAKEVYIKNKGAFKYLLSLKYSPKVF